VCLFRAGLLIGGRRSVPSSVFIEEDGLLRVQLVLKKSHFVARPWEEAPSLSELAFFFELLTTDDRAKEESLRNFTALTAFKVKVLH